MSDVFQFLLGECDLDGVYFGDRHPDKQGSFWWRKSLRKALSRMSDESAVLRDLLADLRPDVEINLRMLEKNSEWAIESINRQKRLLSRIDTALGEQR